VLEETLVETTPGEDSAEAAKPAMGVAEAEATVAEVVDMPI